MILKKYNNMNTKLLVLLQIWIYFTWTLTTATNVQKTEVKDANEKLTDLTVSKQEKSEDDENAQSNALVRVIEYAAGESDPNIKVRSFIMPYHNSAQFGISNSMSLAASSQSNLGGNHAASLAGSASAAQGAGSSSQAFSSSASSSNDSGFSQSQAMAAAASQSEGNGAHSQSFSGSSSQSNGPGNSQSQAMAAAASQSEGNGAHSQSFSGSASMTGGVNGAANSQSFSGSASMTGGQGNAGGMSMSNSQSLSSPNFGDNRNIMPYPMYFAFQEPMYSVGLRNIALKQTKLDPLLAMTNFKAFMPNTLISSGTGNLYHILRGTNIYK